MEHDWIIDEYGTGHCKNCYTIRADYSSGPIYSEITSFDTDSIHYEIIYNSEPNCDQIKQRYNDRLMADILK